MGPASDSATINLSSRKLIDRYADASLKCSAYHIHYSGMDLKNTYLKLDKHYLSFVPYLLSLKRLLLLTPMMPEEAEYFLGFREQTHSVQFSFNSDIFGQKVDFLLMGRVMDIRKANPNLNMVLIEFRITQMSNAYREIFIDMMVENDRLRALYDNEDRGERIFDGACYREIFGVPMAKVTHLVESTEGFVIEGMSLKRLRIYGPVESGVPLKGEILKVTLVDDQPPLIVSGRVESEEDSEEVAGYRVIDMQIDFNPQLAAIMCPFLSGQ